SRIGWLFVASVLGCGGSSDGRGTGSEGGVLTGASGTDSGVATDSTTADSGPTSGQGSGPIFDVGIATDVPEMTGPVIPETCDQADEGKSSVGCVFYAVDLDSSSDGLQYAVVTANVQQTVTANVSVQTKDGGAWADVA